MFEDGILADEVFVDAPAAESRTAGEVLFDSADAMFCTDEFRMYEMKIKRCPRARPHDWTLCPFAHPGEKAKRRDPRKFTYSGTACAEYRKAGHCARGDACVFAHGVFECWLHPNRYRTQLCTDGTACTRRVCFFAHRECEIRQVPVSALNLGPPILSSAAPQLQGNAVTDEATLQGHGQLAQALENYFQGQKTRKEQAITAAAQLLDPLAKLRLMQMLQGHTSAGAAPQSAVNKVSLEYQPTVDPSVLLGLRRLSLGSRPEGSACYQPSYPSAEALHVPQHGNGAMLGVQASGDLFGAPALARRSVDIGSLSRMGAAPLTAQEGSMASARMDKPQAGRMGTTQPISFSVDLSDRSSTLPHLGPLTSLIHGSLPTASYMEFAAGLGRTAAAGKTADNGNEMSGGSHSGRDTAAPHTASGSSSTMTTWGGATTAVSGLQSIDELGPVEDESGSSAVSCMGRSGSASSSLDIAGKESIPFHRVVSFDNILAELPRSASQVNMVDLA